MTTAAAELVQPDAGEVLTKALLRASEAFGLSRTELAEIIGRDRSSIYRTGIDPNSKAGELALYLLRIYRGLYALVGGDEEALRHWMRTDNRHVGGIPLQRLHSIAGLVEVLTYLDAMRGRA